MCGFSRSVVTDDYSPAAQLAGECLANLLAGVWRAVMGWCFGSPTQSLHVSLGIGLGCFRVAYVGMLTHADIAAEQLLRRCMHALGFLYLSQSPCVSPGGALGCVCMLFLTVELPTVPTNRTGLAAVLAYYCRLQLSPD